MKQESKEKILEAASAALSRKPHWSMEQLAENIGVSRTTLYRHFESKEALLKAIIKRSDEAFNKILQPLLDKNSPALEKLENFVREFVPAGIPFYFLFFNDIFLKDKETADLYLKQSEALTRLALLLQKEGYVNKAVPAEWFAASLEYLIYASWEKIRSGDLAAKRAPELIIDTLLNGMGE